MKAKRNLFRIVGLGSAIVLSAAMRPSLASAEMALRSVGASLAPQKCDVDCSIDPRHPPMDPPRPGNDRASFSGTIDKSTGLDDATSVTVRIGAFTQTLPIDPNDSSRVHRSSDGHIDRFRFTAPWSDRDSGRPYGIEGLWVYPVKGRFKVSIATDELRNSPNPLPVSLSFGAQQYCALASFAEYPPLGRYVILDRATLTSGRVVDPLQPPRVRWLGRWRGQYPCEPLVPKLTPSSVMVGRTVNVRVTIEAPNASTTDLRVVDLDSSQAEVGTRCYLSEATPAPHRTVACTFDANEDRPGEVRLAVVGTRADGVAVRSSNFFLSVSPTLSQTDAEQAINHLNEAAAAWESARNRYGSSPATIDSAAADMMTIQNALTVWKADDELIAVFRAGGGVTTGRFQLPASGGRSASPPTAADLDLASDGGAAAEGLDNSTGNANVLIWAPELSDFFDPSSLQSLISAYGQSQCPMFHVTVVRDQSCTMASLLDFNRYGTVIIAAAGEPPLRVLRGQDDGMILIDHQSLFQTSQPANVMDFMADWTTSTGRAKYAGILQEYGIPIHSTPVTELVYSDSLHTWVWAVRPEYFEENNRRFPNSVIWAGWSYSADPSSSFANVFRGLGAQTVLGINGKTSAPFVGARAVDFFHAMLEGATAANALGGIQRVDPSTGASIQLAGNGDATYDGADGNGLVNGSFETGTFDGWNFDDSAAVLPALPPYLPPAGQSLATILVQYPRFVSSIVGQSVCPARTGARLQFWWSLLSEEFARDCFNYDDHFVVVANGSAVFSTSVAALCFGGSTHPIANPPFGHGPVAGTFWRFADVPLPASALPLNLGFELFKQRGDDGTTVILIDDVRIVNS